MTDRPTFVVGTGRCGSTMLSNMLREHPKVLSLSEFFAWLVDSGTRLAETFSPTPLNGERFWDVAAAINSVSSFGYRHRIPCDEQLYPYEAPSSRFSAQTGVPAILITSLPHLTTDHDALFDLLRDEVRTWPERTMAKHYEALFAWLVVHFGKELWVERSGGALHMLGYYERMFPKARFIHVARDGRDVALSMQGHLGMRLYFVMSTLAQHLGVDPIESADRQFVDRVPPELQAFLPERFDADAFRALRMPATLCAQYWAFQIETGLGVLRSLPPERLLTVRYEDVIADPERQLDAISGFLGEEMVDEEWALRCAATVRRPRSTWRDLPADQASAIAEVCRPGFELLRDAGVQYAF